MLIGGKWVDGKEKIDVRSPFSGELLAEVSVAGTDDLNDAVGAAESAARQMRTLSRFEIAKGLHKIADGIEARKDEFIDAIISESAKPYRYAKGEVERGIATFYWAAGEAERFVGEVVPIDVQPNGANKFGRTLKIPRGVIYGITPFNFPLNLVAHKVAPALASGNAIIIKPSDRTPLTSLLLGEVFLESGLPESALQVVLMDVGSIDNVYADERIKMISFTGSALIGWGIKSKASKKFVTLELGGNASVIVDGSADIQNSVDRCIVGSFAYSGQVCISVQRIFVHGSIFEKWLERFVEQAEKLVFGDPNDSSTEISVMIDEPAAIRTENWISEAIESGAKLICGGKRQGKFMQPTILTDTDRTMKVVAEEAFAPVVIVERSSSFEEALEMANDGKYGLQAGVFTADLHHAKLAADRLEYGGVIINDVPSFRVDNMPYGGMKESGFGREGVKYAMEEMTEPRLIIHSYLPK